MEREKGYFLLGVTNPFSRGKCPQKECTYLWTILANIRNHAITEINVCAKLEEHWSNIVTLEQELHIR